MSSIDSRGHGVWALAALLLLPVGAQARDILEDPRSLGMGGAVRGDPMGANAIFHNVAGMARAYTYAAQAQYIRTGSLELNGLGGNVVDSKTQPSVAVGASYFYQFSDTSADAELDVHDARLAFASAIVPGQIFAGVGLHYLNFQRPAALGEELNALTLDAGVHAMLAQQFAVGITGHNLIKVDDGAWPMEAGVGFAYINPAFTLDFDFLLDFTTDDDGVQPVYRVGTEVFLGEAVPLRLGYSRFQATETQYISGGLGFVNSSGQATGSGFNVGYRGNLDDSKDFLVSVGLTMYL